MNENHSTELSGLLLDPIYRSLSRLASNITLFSLIFPHDLNYAITDIARVDYMLRNDYEAYLEVDTHTNSMYWAILRMLILSIYEISRLIKNEFTESEEIQSLHKFFAEIRMPVAKYQKQGSRVGFDSIPIATTEKKLRIELSNGTIVDYGREEIILKFMKLLELAVEEG